MFQTARIKVSLNKKATHHNVPQTPEVALGCNSQFIALLFLKQGADVTMTAPRTSYY